MTKKKIMMINNQVTTKILLSILILIFYYAYDVRCAVVQMDSFKNMNDKNKIQLTLDTSEAAEVLAILTRHNEGKQIEKEEWQKLFETVPYKCLKERQINIAQRFNDSTLVLNDDDFAKFILSDDLVKHTSELKATLESWEKADLYSAAEKILRYLPDSAKIRTKIYPIIKPGRNSFVWNLSTDPTIFLNIDIDVTRDKFANTVAHELHHIGLASVNTGYDKKISSLPEKAYIVSDWIGAFGEGMAMLAAAGSPKTHPHKTSPESERAQWDNDMANFNNDLKSVDSFFVDILTGKLADKDSIDAKGSSFFGIQGPWYTVGYKMCALVEKRFGRSVLIQTMLDPRRLLALYNRVAKEENAISKKKLPLWSAIILKQIEAKP